MRIANRVAAFFWPLERQLPLLIAALLCAVVGAFGWLAHEALERAFEVAAAERLVVAAHRMSALVVESVSSVRSEGEAFARNPALAALLSQPGELAPARADSTLNALQASGTRASSRAVWTVSTASSSSPRVRSP